MGSEGVVYSASVIDDDFPITSEDIGKATLFDPVLGKVHQFVMSGWPKRCPDGTLKPYHNRRNELSCEQDCVLWGTRVIIPSFFRAKMLGQFALGTPWYKSYESYCSYMHVVAKNGSGN